ncbi:MAG: (d)CMP kinase [Gammaproteobacteria bacterium]|nr:(d)CMP kinase [Gammaproteobacteria bacterium]
MTESTFAAVPVIAIDGPSGSGKGTIAQALATELGWHFLDSGALYRILAFAAQQQGIALDDAGRLAELGLNLPVSFSTNNSNIILNDIDISTEIRTESVGNAASQVAVIPAVRAALLARQRAFCRPPGLVADGRDMGTVVFPDAPLKLFLTASAEERARRRYKQLIEKGLSASLPTLAADIAERDRRDANRAVAPLKPADDAIVIDTSTLDIGATLARVRDLVRHQLPWHPS